MNDPANLYAITGKDFMAPLTYKSLSVSCTWRHLAVVGHTTDIHGLIQIEANKLTLNLTSVLSAIDNQRTWKTITAKISKRSSLLIIVLIPILPL